MEPVRDLVVAKLRFKEAMINLSQKETEYKKSNEKCIAGQIKVELWRLELAKAEAAIKETKIVVKYEAVPVLGGLPTEILLAIFAHIPVDERIRCEQVCRGWHQLLRQSFFWETIDISTVRKRGERMTDDILLDLALRTWETTGNGEDMVLMEVALREWKRMGRAHACGKFGFGLKHLNVSGCTRLSVEMIMAVVRMSSSLQELVAIGCKRFAARNFVELHSDLSVVADAELLVPAPADMDIMARLLKRSPPEFRYVCLHELCVIGRDLNVDEVELLASGLRENRSISSLRLTYCGLKDDHMIVLESALEGNSVLTSLGLGGNDELGWPSILALGRFLNSATCSLRILSLDSCFIGNEKFTLLQSAIKNASNLRQLDLSYNDLTEVSAPRLEELFTTNTSLTDLDLASNWLRSPGVANLALGLSRNSSLRKLDLKGNEMGAEGAVSLANALKVNSVLQTLHIHHNNNLGVEGSSALVEALRVNRSITSLKVEVSADSLRAGEVLIQALQCSPVLNKLTLTMCGNDISEDLMRFLSLKLRDWTPRLAVCRCCPRHSPQVHQGFAVGQLLGAADMEVIARRAQRSRTWRVIRGPSCRHKIIFLMGVSVLCGVALWYFNRRSPKSVSLYRFSPPTASESDSLVPFKSSEGVQVQ